jgi:hypothetical protein
VNNSSGSTATSLTYADGSTVATSPAATTSSSATSSYNFIAQMIQRQASAMSFLTNPSLSFSV